MPIREEEISVLMKAFSFAAQKHRNQRRKDAVASPYINHPIAVAYTLWETGDVRDIPTVISGILHDTIEDTETTSEEIEKEFGNEIRKVVEEVSDDKSIPKSERKRLQIEKAKYKSTRAKNVKLADKICNIQDIISSPPIDWPGERRRKYIEWAQAVVNQVRGTNPKLEKFFDDLCLKAIQQSEAE